MASWIKTSKDFGSTKEIPFEVLFQSQPQSLSKKQSDPTAIKYMAEKNDIIAVYCNDKTIRIFDGMKKIFIFMLSVGSANLLELRENFEMISSSASLLEKIFLLYFVDSKVLYTFDINNKKFLKKQTYIGHKDFITRYLIDGPVLYTTSNDRTIKAWELKTGKCIGTYDGHSDSVMCIECVNMGEYKLLLTGGADFCIKIWYAVNQDKMTIPTLKSLRVLTGHKGWVFGIKTLGSTIFSASLDETIQAWDLVTFKQNEIFNMKDICPSFRVDFRVHYEDWIFLCSSEQFTIVPWNFKISKHNLIFKGHEAEIKSLKILDHFLLSASADRTIRLWNLKDGLCLNIFKGHFGSINSISTSGSFMYSASEDGSLRKWKLEDLHSKLSKNEKKELVKETKQLIKSNDDEYNPEWWVGFMSRQDAESQLSNHDYNVFLIREGSTPGYLVLSKYNSTANAHVHILISQGKEFQLQKSIDIAKYPSLSDLVANTPELDGYVAMNERKGHHYGGFLDLQ